MLGWKASLDCVQMTNLSRLLCPLLALLCLLVSGTAAAASGPQGDLISERGVWPDATGTLTIDTVPQAPFKRLTGPAGLGNKGVPTWLRLVVPPQPAERDTLVLMLQPASIESMQVYLPGPDGTGWRRVDSGSHVAYSARQQRTLNFTLPFKPRREGPTTLYVRLQTFTGVAHAQVLTPEASADFDTRLHTGLGLYLGFATLMVLLSGSLWLSTRRALWGLAALFDLSTIVHVAVPSGLVAQYLLPDASERLPTLMYLSTTTHLLTAGLLWAHLVRVLEAPRWVSWGYWLALPYAALCYGLVATGHGSAVQGLVVLGVFVLTLWGGMVMWAVRPADRLMRWLYWVLNGALMLYLLYFSLPILRAQQSSVLSLYPALPSNMVTMVMVLALITRRTVLDQREAARLLREKLHSERRLEQEQAHHAETAGMLGMIMHEVKNPLASIRMASELLRSGRSRTPEEEALRFATIEQAVAGIDTVLQRCIDLDRLEHGALQEHRDDEDVAALLRHWLGQHREASRLRAELPATLPARVDARLLILLVSNLTENALKYSPAGSPVTVRLQGRDARLQLAVRNAVGRAGRPDPERVFTKYYRSAKAQYASGTGLGLYGVQQVSVLMGGRAAHLVADDEVIFTLELPR